MELRVLRYFLAVAREGSVTRAARRLRAVQARYPRIRVHVYSGDRSDLAQRLEQGLLDFAVLVESSDLSRYNYLPLPDGDIWGASCAGTTLWRGRRGLRRRSCWMCP